MRPKEFYEYQTGHGDLVSGGIRKAARLFARHLPSAERLLDIGCGVGNIALYLKEATGAKEVHGVDIAESLVEAARQRGVQAVALDINVDSLPVEDGFFDAIFCGEVIEHLVDEIYRTLSPRGVCVLTTPNLAGWYNRLALLLGYQPFPASVSFRYTVGRRRVLGRQAGTGHLRVFTYAALVQFLKLHSFTIVDAAGVGILESGSPAHLLSRVRLAVKLLTPIDRALSLFPSLSSHVVVAATKTESKPGEETI